MCIARRRLPATVALVLAAAGLTACQSSSSSSGRSGRASQPYRYVDVPGKSARLLPNGRAVAPPNAPAIVHRAVAAGNELIGKPYVWGGGHKRLHDRGYDCSGTASYVLNRCGLLRGSMPSKGFRSFGKSGAGEWITLYTKDGHVFLVIAGLRLDTGGGHRDTGPRWKPGQRSTRGFSLRHPSGL